MRKVNSLEIGGACMALSEALKNIIYAPKLSAEEIWQNTSELRDNNRIDVIEPIYIDEDEELEISSIYFDGEIAKAIVYNNVNEVEVDEILLTL